MSFILDALKKSETERQQQGSAEFATVPVGKTRARTPRWIWVIAALLGINIAAMLGLMLRPDTPPANVASPSPAVIPAETPVPHEDQPGPTETFEEKIAEARDRQPEVALTTPVAEMAPDVAQEAAPAATGTVTNDVPSLVELQAAGRVQVAPLHLDIHVFSYVPSERFVFINMNKATEGSTLDEGPRVEEITVDGVMLRYQGETFKLTRE
ncbi:MAG: GspB domain-containing protein [Gammaproteobacteria bacterium]|nr:GspB domain-containing protein [Gammaproteobacteria bacterium]